MPISFLIGPGFKGELDNSVVLFKSHSFNFPKHQLELTGFISQFYNSDDGN